MAAKEEDDYMSDAFLLGLEDTRPGLAFGVAAREYKKEAKRKQKDAQNKTKPLKERESERREKALSNAIDSSNKGFALLAKMGYKEGKGLGKQGEGRKEPIPLSIKEGRGGLGQESEMKRKQELQEKCLKVARDKRIKLEAKQREDFREKQKEIFSNKLVEKDLFQSQKACEQLDKAENMSCKEVWFWPERLNENEDDENDEVYEEEVEELESSEKLVILTEYLRRTHKYCIWCGTSYTDEEDLDTHCPGDTSTAHD
ncbi:G patch domain-containing protein 11-like [Dendronephthya gigantea]|uniref:G patch domain-containing protein 11-like n=1 Tax=Dendronephthya gigantea TaxID=151771 RepID=UPI00106923DC|nr:G patch domain-containing protein 11-like [Dendronephthya gigantea]